LATQVPASLPLVAPKLAALAQNLNCSAKALALLETSYVNTPSLDVLNAIVTLHKAQGDTQTSNLFAKHLEREPSLVAATQWIANEKFEHEEFHPQVQRALERAAKPLQRYRCAACGFEASQHFWHCPGCQAWDSYPARRVEEL
jgi:lipopolysaccharide biosynthesis regulator YciM